MEVLAPAVEQREVDPQTLGPNLELSVAPLALELVLRVLRLFAVPSRPVPQLYPFLVLVQEHRP
jgi:hypothetical protein